MNEQLEYLRLCIIEVEDDRRERIKLFQLHYGPLGALAGAVGGIHPPEERRSILLKRFDVEYAQCVLKSNLMPIVDTLCEIYQKTNNNNVRRLIDEYKGGWDSVG